MPIESTIHCTEVKKYLSKKKKKICIVDTLVVCCVHKDGGSGLEIIFRRKVSTEGKKQKMVLKKYMVIAQIERDLIIP